MPPNWAKLLLKESIYNAIPAILMLQGMAPEWVAKVLREARALVGFLGAWICKWRVYCGIPWSYCRVYCWDGYWGCCWVDTLELLPGVLLGWVLGLLLGGVRAVANQELL